MGQTEAILERDTTRTRVVPIVPIATARVGVEPEQLLEDSEGVSDA